MLAHYEITLGVIGEDDPPPASPPDHGPMSCHHRILFERLPGCVRRGARRQCSSSFHDPAGLSRRGPRGTAGQVPGSLSIGGASTAAVTPSRARTSELAIDETRHAATGSSDHARRPWATPPAPPEEVDTLIARWRIVTQALEQGAAIQRSALAGSVSLPSAGSSLDPAILADPGRIGSKARHSPALKSSTVWGDAEPSAVAAGRSSRRDMPEAHK